MDGTRFHHDGEPDDRFARRDRGRRGQPDGLGPLGRPRRGGGCPAVRCLRHDHRPERHLLQVPQLRGEHGLQLIDTSASARPGDDARSRFTLDEPVPVTTLA